MRNNNQNLLTVLAILTSLVLIIAGVGLEERTSAQKPVTHPDGSTTTSEDVNLGPNGYGTKETTKDTNGKKTKEETKDEKGRVVERVEYNANGTVRIWEYDRRGRLVFFVMKWTQGGPFGDQGAIGREIKYKDDYDTTGTAADYARVGIGGLRRATDDETTFLGVAIKPDPLATPNPGSNEAPGLEQPAINVESVIGDLFPGKKKEQEQEAPKSNSAGPETKQQPTAKPTPKVEIDPKYKFEFKTSPGLNTETFTLPSGTKISVNLPDDMSAGDTITGTVRTEVAGKDEKQRAKNQAELEKIVLHIGGQSMPATGKMFTRSIRANLDVKLDERFILLAVNGKQVCSVAVPIAQNPPPAPQNPQLPTCGQMGRNVVVKDHCDGIIAPTDSCSIGGTTLQPLAESPRMRVMQNTSEVPGPTEIKYSEQGKEVTGPFQNLGVKLTSPNANLLRGQKTTLEVVASVQGIQQDVSLDLVNDRPGIVSISGGDNQHFTIHPTDVQGDGTYKQNFTVTANQAGAWGATATVSCVGTGGPQAAASPAGVAAPGAPVVPIVPTPTPTPTPAHRHPTPSPPSPSPCGPTPTPTTYTVKDLKELPTLDGSTPHCMATGVNDAGNVVGACQGKYKGGPVSGAWRAFRTDTGGALIKKKDDLGFPDGEIGGVSFAMAVNKGAHVVGYWADAPTGGADHKGFWYDGSKMINLHPSTFPLKVSEAYALNKSDDVVGAAWTLFSDKHAVIWPGGDHTMIDLNDCMEPASKKDWKLIEAYAINDAGEIVGRAKHLDKLHAFLLKSKGAVPKDLGAIAEFKDDSSAAYSINACDEVVGYTNITGGVEFHGFVWKEDSGMKDMGTLSPPYTFSYAQAINKKGEVVGAVSLTFHTSETFEGVKFLGKGGSGKDSFAYSHAVWYNGSVVKDLGVLKDLNELIPASPGWELNLANGINDMGQIAGSGFYKESPYSKAVLLSPPGLTPPATASAGATSSSCPISIGSGDYIFNNWNICLVKNGPTKDTTFTIDAPYLITFIATYHWNDGKGAVPGSKGISLESSDGTVYGPFVPVITSAGSGGAAYVNWECHPMITLPAGTYTVVDPDPITWSQNDASGNKGFVRVAGSKK